VSPNPVDRQFVQEPEATAAQYLAGVLGVAYLVTGLLGFAVTGSMGFTAHDPQVQMAGLTINPLHNVVHAVVGALGVAAFTRSTWARGYGVLVLVAFGALALLGFLGLGSAGMNMNGPDNWLHAATAVLGLLMVLVPTRAGRGSSQVAGSAPR